MISRLARIGAAVAISGLLALQYSPRSMAGPTAAHAFNYASLTQLQKRLLSGFAEYELNQRSAARSSEAIKPSAYFPYRGDNCPTNLDGNIKINQNCLNLTDSDLQGRGQAQNETSIAQDPNNPAHIIASSNDYRRGDGNCYSSYSVDTGRTWTDSTVPMGFTRGDPFGATRQYWQAGGDTSVAWDTKGNAYLSCQVFNRGAGVTTSPDQSSALLVFRSTLNNGASWNFPGRYVVANNDVAGAGMVLEDKQLLTVDNHVGSPYQDRVYVTWTEFAADGTAYIYESYSSDYGETFSPRVLVSAPSALCPNPSPTAGACTFNQFSQPFTGPDGTLYVAWANFNNATSHGIPGGAAVANPNDNYNQILLARSSDGGQTFSAPVKVSNYYDLPDCATYQNGQDNGRSCVPEKGPTFNSFFRAVNYPSGAVNPQNPQQVVVTFGSYINAHSNETQPNPCVPAGFNPLTNGNLFTGVKTANACNNDILVSVSTDGGTTFSGASTDPRMLTSATQQPGQATSDQFWQWAAFTKDGKLAVSYYDRQYGSDEATGYSDVSLSGSRDLTSFGSVRVTSSSMPPPTQFEGTFYGDYTGLSAAYYAHPIWMDTRSPDLFLCPGTGITGVAPGLCTASGANATIANDQDIFTAAVAVPTR